MRAIGCLLLLLFSGIHLAQDAPRAPHLPDHSKQLEAIAFLAGTFEGIGKNPLGAYHEEFTGNWDVNKTVFTVRSTSTMEGMIVFEDLRVFSWDNVNKRIRMRQWAMGDLITYDVTTDGDKVVCTEAEHEGKARGEWRYTLEANANGFAYTLEEKQRGKFAHYLGATLVPSPGARGPARSHESIEQIDAGEGQQLSAFVSVPEGEGSFPVIVFSPGGQAATYRGYEDFTRWFSSWGFICVTVAFNTGTAAERAVLFTKVADWLKTENASDESPLKGKVDDSRLVAAGHSRGGHAALAVCASDARFTACLAFAPAGPDECKSEHKPAVCIVAGDEDEALAGKIYGALAGPRQLVVVRGMDHMLSPASAMMKGLSRAQAFLNWRVKGEQAYAELAKHPEKGIEIKSAD